MKNWKLDLGEEVKVCSILTVLLYYANNVDKAEYPDFEDWKVDMMKQGLLVKIV